MQTPTTQTPTTEVTKRWEELTEAEMIVVFQVHAIALKITKHSKAHDTLKQIFDLGRPQIVFGYKNDGKPGPDYCRIDTKSDSAEVMKLLIREYL